MRRFMSLLCLLFFFFNDAATTQIYTLSLHDALPISRPWTVVRDLRRNPNPRPTWGEFICAEGNGYVRIGKETYFLSAAGLLMPMLKGQQPPDLRHFK